MFPAARGAARRDLQRVRAARQEVQEAAALLPPPLGTRRGRQVSRDWWTAGHVTSVLTSDWSRAGPGVKNFVRERRRESCRERCFKKKHVYRRKPRPRDTNGISGPSSDPELDSDVDTAAPATRGSSAGPWHPIHSNSDIIHGIIPHPHLVL